MISDNAVLGWFIDTVMMPAFRPILSKINVWRWADKSVFLDAKSRSTAGNYDSALTPHTREFQETATDPAWDEDHVIKSSRTGFTEASLNILRFAPEHAPGQALYAIDSAEEVKKISRDRLIPTLRSAAAAAITDDPDDISSKIIRLATMVIHLAGSYSAGIFRNKWLRWAILDEVEVNSSIDGEGTLHDLARSRMTDVEGSKLFTLSKPTRWGSVHHRECVTGTLSAYLVPCPICGTFQELSIDGESPTSQLRIESSLRDGEPPLSPRLSAPAQRVGRLRYEHCKTLTGEWDFDRIEEETWYECVSGCRIPDDILLKKEMFNQGRWLATNPRPTPRKRSRHISDLYALHPKMSWGKLALIYVESLGDARKLMHFVNNHLGLPFRDKAADISEEQILECRSAYLRGTVPWDPDIVIIGADSQDAFWKYSVVAFRLNGAGGAVEVALSRWGIATTPAELLAELETPVISPSGRAFAPVLGFVDAGGHRTEQVYDLVEVSQRRLLPCYGRREPTLRTVVWKSEIKHRMRLLDIYFVADAMLKRRLYLGMIGAIRKIKAACVAHAEGRGPTLKALGLASRFHIPGAGEYDLDMRSLVSELQGERLNADGRWERVEQKRNDYGDAIKYALAAFEYLLPLLEQQKAKEQQEAGPPLTSASSTSA